MNKIVKSLFKRKSVRAYADKAISQKRKDIIYGAMLQAPTAGNMCLYTIIDVVDQDIKNTLSVTCDNQPFIAKAPMVSVLCADYRRWFDIFTKYCEDVRLPKEGDLMLAISDTIIAAQNGVVAAESLGISSCYIGDIIENYETHKELLGLPKYVVPVCMLCFGYPTKQQAKRNKPLRFSIRHIVHQDRYNMDKCNLMEQILQQREGYENKDGFDQWIVRFCNRKWNSDFSIEMSRSARAIIDDWCKED